jgi:DNA-binding protein Fis
MAYRLPGTISSENQFERTVCHGNEAVIRRYVQDVQGQSVAPQYQVLHAQQLDLFDAVASDVHAPP